MCYFHSIRLPVQPATSGGRLPPFLSGRCKGGARRTQSLHACSEGLKNTEPARSSYAEPQPTLAEHFPNALQRYNIFRQIPIFGHP